MQSLYIDVSSAQAGILSKLDLALILLKITQILHAYASLKLKSFTSKILCTSHNPAIRASRPANLILVEIRLPQSLVPRW